MHNKHSLRYVIYYYVRELFQNLKAEDNNIYYYAVSVGQDVRSSLAWWSLFRVSHEASVKMLAQECCHLEAQLGELLSGSLRWLLAALSWSCLMAWQLASPEAHNPGWRHRVPKTEDGAFFITRSQKCHPITSAIFSSLKASQVQPTLKGKGLYRSVNLRRQIAFGPS